jgi:hypothetical protein
MFSYKSWDKLCLQLKQNSIKVIPIIEYKTIQNSIDNKSLMIKHDVETNVSKSRDIARIEYRHSIRATYYVQGELLKSSRNVEMLQEIKSMGHEIGYHYDVLDHSGGDYALATTEFLYYLKLFNKYGFEVKSICPHGNPILQRDGWESNACYYSNYGVRKELAEKGYEMLDAIVDIKNARLSNVKFISDAGYTWDQDNYKNLSEVLESILLGGSHLLSTHPHRWYKLGIFSNLSMLKFRLIRFMAKKIYNISPIKGLMDKYYYLAKKI